MLATSLIFLAFFIFNKHTRERRIELRKSSLSLIIYVSTVSLQKKRKEKETDNYEIKKKKKRIPLDFTVCTCLLISPIYSRSTHIGLIKPVNRLLILPIYNTRFLSTVVTLYHLIFTNWLKNHFFLVIAELCSCTSLQVMPFFCWLWHTVD